MIDQGLGRRRQCSRASRASPPAERLQLAAQRVMAAARWGWMFMMLFLALLGPVAVGCRVLLVGRELVAIRVGGQAVSCDNDGGAPGPEQAE